VGSEKQKMDTQEFCVGHSTTTGVRCAHKPKPTSRYCGRHEPKSEFHAADLTGNPQKGRRNKNMEVGDLTPNLQLLVVSYLSFETLKKVKAVSAVGKQLDDMDQMNCSTRDYPCKTLVRYQFTGEHALNKEERAQAISGVDPEDDLAMVDAVDSATETKKKWLEGHGPRCVDRCVQASSDALRSLLFPNVPIFESLFGTHVIMYLVPAPHRVTRLGTTYLHLEFGDILEGLDVRRHTKPGGSTHSSAFWANSFVPALRRHGLRSIVRPDNDAKDELNEWESGPVERYQEHAVASWDVAVLVLCICVFGDEIQWKSKIGHQDRVVKNTALLSAWAAAIRHMMGSEYKLINDFR